MTTRGYIRYVRESERRDGDVVTRRAAAKISADAHPARVATRIAALREDQPYETPTGYAAAHAVGDSATVDELDRSLLDPSAPVPGACSWSYEVVLDARHLSDWQVRVSRHGPPSSDDGWALDGPASIVLPALRQTESAREPTQAFLGLAARHDAPDQSLLDVVDADAGGDA